MSARKKAAHPKAIAQGPTDTLPPSSHSVFVTALLSWYGRNKRDLPWRRTRDPYAIWVSEVMLQQTRVDTVIGYYERFMRAYPTVSALADADLGDVLAKWSGLGYYRRARLLHQGAATVRKGGLPKTARDLELLPGIGRYTAGAIASIAHGEATPIVDGNVSRVLARWFAIEADVSGSAGQRRVWDLAGELVRTPPAPDDAGAFNQALMELGATVCTPRSPRCEGCPVRHHCEARARGLQERLPIVKRKAPPVVWKRVALVAVSGARVLLGRRAGGALMEGMWEPPMADASDEGAETIATGLARALDLALTSVHVVRDVVHVLTHRRTIVTVVRAELSTRARVSVNTRKLVPYDAFALADEGARNNLACTTLTKKLIVAAL